MPRECFACERCERHATSLCIMVDRVVCHCRFCQVYGPQEGHRMPDFGKFLTGTVMFQNKADSVVVTIADVRVISQYDREVIDFEETLYGEYSSLPLNAVNTTRLRKLFGRDRDVWVGQVIELTRYHAPN